MHIAQFSEFSQKNFYFRGKNHHNYHVNLTVTVCHFDFRLLAICAVLHWWCRAGPYSGRECCLSHAARQGHVRVGQPIILFPQYRPTGKTCCLSHAAHQGYFREGQPLILFHVL